MYISKVTVPCVYNTTKEQVVNDLTCVEHFSATTDCWSSHDINPHLSHIVHYIGHEWAIQTCCLQILYLPEDHIASNLADGLEEKTLVMVT